MTAKAIRAGILLWGNHEGLGHLGSGLSPLMLFASEGRCMSVLLDIQSMCGNEGNANPEMVEVKLSEGSSERAAAAVQGRRLAESEQKCKTEKSKLEVQS